jgi:hypothetical protein
VKRARYNQRGRRLASIRTRNALRLFAYDMRARIFAALCCAPHITQADRDRGIAVIARAAVIAKYPPAPEPGSIILESVKVAIDADGMWHVTAARRPLTCVTFRCTVDL